MKLSLLLNGIKYVSQNFVDVDVVGLTHNSKTVAKDFLFFAISDGVCDGREFVPEAVANGARVVVCASGSDFDKNHLGNDVVVVEVGDVRFAMSILARNFYGKPDEQLCLIGVVGSNGKTTTSTIIYEILQFANKSAGIIGTNGVKFGGHLFDSGMTTPDPIELFSYLAQMVVEKIEYVVMEVSAHSIYYQKIAEIKFDVGVFTNISNEHLDFFGDMENYAHVKKSFFSPNYVKECVINIDDDLGMQIAYDADIPCVSFGLTRPANIFALDTVINFDYMSFVVNAFDDILRIKSRLVGDYNVYNIMASIGVCRLVGLDDESIVGGISNIQNVEGRWQTYDIGNDNKVVVDYAHTPDGFDKVLSLVKSLRTGKITTIFGCVGYSDSEKRTQMGEVSSRYSDKVIITTDNICDAKFEDIVCDIAKNIECEYQIIENREQAISNTLNSLTKGETVVILGKGNEKYQKIGKEKIPYSDIDVVKKYIENK